MEKAIEASKRPFGDPSPPAGPSRVLLLASPRLPGRIALKTEVYELFSPWCSVISIEFQSIFLAAASESSASVSTSPAFKPLLGLRNARASKLQAAGVLHHPCDPFISRYPLHLKALTHSSLLNNHDWELNGFQQAFMSNLKWRYKL